MGYGHSRAAFSLKDLSLGRVITANHYPGIPDHERRLWTVWRQGYETLSRLHMLPLIGGALFEVAEWLQEIPEFYPRRDLSETNFAVREVARLVEHHGLGKHLVRELNRDPLPAVCTHPVPAVALEYHGFTGDIWCVPTDADIARAWVSKDPQQSRIKYVCANGRLMDRLRLYGVPADHLFLTGFPLPKELIGGKQMPILRRQLLTRLCNLDPAGEFIHSYKETIARRLGLSTCTFKRTHPLTLTYAVGGAGAQREIGMQLLESLRLAIKRRQMRVQLVAGTRHDVARLYEEVAHILELPVGPGRGVEIVFSHSRRASFAAFDGALANTDILWTKPSELSFYTGLGLPIIMAPPIGRQEEFNAQWLLYVGGGLRQHDPRYTHEWLFDWLNAGGLARAAWNGYLEAPTYGTYRIEDLIQGRQTELRPLPLIV